MNERRARQQLLRKYLIQMDLGDPKAEVMVDKIAKTMNDAEERIAMGEKIQANQCNPSRRNERMVSVEERSVYKI